MKKIIAIPSKNLGDSGYSMYISIYKTLKSNGYTCYFLEPNSLVRNYLLKSGVKAKDILEVKTKINTLQKYDGKSKKEYSQLNTFIKIFFGKLAYKSILKESLQEYSKYEVLIKKYKINKLIVYNGIFRIGRLAGLDNNCEIVYFENGYFPNTLQIDNRGINSESSIANIKYEDILEYKKNNANKIKSIGLLNEKINTNILQKIYLNLKSYNYKTSFFYILYIIKKTRENIKRQVLYIFIKEIKLEETRKYVLIALQVHDDTQIVFNSPLIKNMHELIDISHKNIKVVLPDYQIVVKEHPMDIGRINYLELQKKYPDILWIKKGDIDDIIKKSEYVFCVNSSVGFQGLSMYKKVFTFGNNFYSSNPWVEKLRSKDSFMQQLLQLKEKKIDKKEVTQYINIFKNDLFISGSGKGWAWENYDTKTIKEICEYIVK